MNANRNGTWKQNNHPPAPPPTTKNGRERKLWEIFQFLHNPIVNNTLIWHQCAEYMDRLLSPGCNLSGTNKINYATFE
jgi:hypothetical protein